MPDDVRVLRLGDMMLRREGTLTRRFVQVVFSVALRLFFRRIETSGARLVPETGALIFVLNHPNGLIDAALVFCALPRRISFLAKSTLFHLPLVGFFLRAAETLPLYRRVDEGADMTQNSRTFEACRALLRRGRCIALFPEGVSHNVPRLMPVKTGAARIALGALSIGEAVATTNGPAGASSDATGETSPRSFDLRIVPVGLYYTSKTTFRSEALLRFGRPVEVRPVAFDVDGERSRAAVKELSARIETALLDVTLNADTEEQLEVARHAEKLFSSIYEGINIERSLTARFDFLRRFVARRVIIGQEERSSAHVENLRRRILSYEEELRRIGVAPENLSLSRHSGWYVLRHFLLRAALILALSPLSFVGAALHLPAYLFSTLIARSFTRHGIDEARATIKILLAIILMPLTWLVVAGLCFYFFNWRAGVAGIPLSVLCGYVALRSLEALYDMRGWFKAVLLLFNRRQLFLRLLFERRALHQEIGEIEQGSRD
ncbi:MAG: lysophospholipid acyltransferase family protein [Pyrinomonadaceae bacterium]